MFLIIVDPVHKAGLNESFMNPTDLILENSLTK